MKNPFLALIILLGVTFAADAGLILGSPTFVNTGTNSATFLTNNATVTVPAISLTISGLTNNATICTNNIATTLTVNGTSVTVNSQFIFNANGSTNDFSTNFPVQVLLVTNRTLLQSIPQTPGVNNYFIQANN